MPFVELFQMGPRQVDALTPSEFERFRYYADQRIAEARRAEADMGRGVR